MFVNTKTLSKADADALICREEDHFYDKKASSIAGKQVQKIAVALANADGGELRLESRMRRPSQIRTNDG